MKYLGLCIVFFLNLIFQGCGNSNLADGGGVSETTNGISGVVTLEGEGVADLEARLYTKNFNPVKEEPLQDTTDDDGQFSFSNLTDSTYNLEVIDNQNGKVIFLQNISIHEVQEIELSVNPLNSPGSILIAITELGFQENGFVFIPGSNIYIKLDSSEIVNKVLIINDVAPGNYNGIYYFENITDTAFKNIINNTIDVQSKDTLQIGVYSAWSHSRNIWLETTAPEINLQEDVYNFPLVIRLNEVEINFSQTNVTGDDLRFSKSNLIDPLPFEIEMWDTENKIALIWVHMDTIFSNSNSQSIRMFWGNENAGSRSNGTIVFDTTNGMVGVWHLNQENNNGTGKIQDATNYMNHGTSWNIPNSNNLPGLLGSDINFNGKNSYIHVVNHESLNLGTGDFTISAWVNPDSIKGIHQILSKRNSDTIGMVGNYEIQMEHNKHVVGYLDVLRTKTGDTRDSISSVDTIKINQWNYILMKREGNLVSFYMNGVEQQETISSNKNLSSSGDLNIGRDDFFREYFNGSIDEVRISRKSRSADWIRLCYETQKADSKVIRFD